MGPSTLAAAAFVLTVAALGAAPPPHHAVTRARSLDAASNVASAPTADPPAAVAAEHERTLRAVSLETWPLVVPGAHLDAATATRDHAVVATRDPAPSSLEPARIRILAVDRKGAASALWRGGVLGASPVATHADDSGTLTLSAWSQATHPGRTLAFVIAAPQKPDPAQPLSHQLLAPGEGPFEPSGAPLVAPIAARRAEDGTVSPGGWLVCSRSDLGPPRCATVARDGQTTRWQTLSGLKSFPLWRLLPTERGFDLMAASCKVEVCRRPRIVLQHLDAAGVPTRPLRVIARMRSDDALGVTHTAAGTLLVGRRANAREATALLISRRGVRELDGGFSRVRGTVPIDEGALTFEVATLTMRGGHPVASTRPRRWIPGDGRQDAERWPETVRLAWPTSLDQQLLTSGSLATAWETTSDGGVRGLAVRPGPAPQTVAEAPTKLARP